MSAKGDSMNPMRGVRAKCVAFGRQRRWRQREPVCVFRRRRRMFDPLRERLLDWKQCQI